MDPREHSLDLLQRIAASLPLETEPAEAGGGAGTALTWDEVDQCSLTFDDDLALVMSFDDEGDGLLLLTWVVGALPEDAEAREEVMLDLLHGNHEWNLTEGGTLGVDEGTGLVTLCYRIDLPLEPPDLITSIVPRLYNVSLHWCKTLLAAEPEAEAEPEPEAEESPAPTATAAPEPAAAAPTDHAKHSVRDNL